MKTIKVKYLKPVTSPADRAGDTGDEKELPTDVANHLASEGYVKIVGDETDDDDSGEN